MHVKAKDQVVVLTGKDKSPTKRATVLSVDREKRRALVQGVAMVKKHARANPRKGVQGGIIEQESSVDVSNLMVVCPQCSAPTRARSERREGKLVRVCRKCSAPMDK